MSNGAVQAFSPAGSVTVNVVTGEAVAVPLPPGGASVLVMNANTDLVFVKLGASNVVATNTDMPVLPGTRLLLHGPAPVNTISVLAQSGDGPVYVARGSGTAH